MKTKTSKCCKYNKKSFSFQLSLSVNGSLRLKSVTDPGGEQRIIPIALKVRLYWSESESDVAPRAVHRESNLMFTLSSDKDHRKKFTFTFAFD